MCSRVPCLPPLHGMVPLGPGPRYNVPPIIRLFKTAGLPYLPFIPALSQITCKYHAIQHHLQRLRLHQPSFTPIHTHHRSTGAGGVQTMTMPRRGGGGACICMFRALPPPPSAPNVSLHTMGLSHILLAALRAPAFHVAPKVLEELHCRCMRRLLGDHFEVSLLRHFIQRLFILREQVVKHLPQTLPRGLTRLHRSLCFLPLILKMILKICPTVNKLSSNTFLTLLDSSRQP